MHPKVNEIYQELAEKYKMKGPFLEIGAGAGEDAILSGVYFHGKPQRFATNLSDKDILDEEGGEKIEFIRCNSQNMRDVFADGQFATVLSNAVLEHDKYFWRSLDEIKRVLAPGGILAVGAPGYIPRSALPDGIINEKIKSATATMDVHSAPDYWRFSRSAFKEVICEGLELLEMRIFARVPTLIAVARMPLGGLLPQVPQEERSRVRAVDKEIKVQKREARAQRLAARLSQQADAAAAPVEEASAKPRKINPAKAAKLQEREARLQERAAKMQKRSAKTERAASSETPKKEQEAAKLGARTAKLEARDAKIKARKIKAEPVSPSETVEVDAPKSLDDKRESGRKRKPLED